MVNKNKKILNIVLFKTKSKFVRQPYSFEMPISAETLITFTQSTHILPCHLNLKRSIEHELQTARHMHNVLFTNSSNH